MSIEDCLQVPIIDDDTFIRDVQRICSERSKVRVTWHEYFATLSVLASARSPCERLHVGCVIVKDNRVLSMGYNGFFAGAPHTSIVAHGHEQATVHAEMNAIAHAARSGIALDKAIAYITHYPCINCYRALVATGIQNIFYIDDYRNDPLVSDLVNVSGVSIHQLCHHSDK
eukprot:CAMPEP_0197290562 /NCGR_PEP_ID=MMETSP0890-20130614/7748_1 /TAXON_ID=44058 ORGANISM="Aureoumbra lagunensis, Strain CCMP1510" /NCGR_SAMPLE_ID=MMETSP0890 /ASSEMBLY_ACC=CAM_ASM_000533 /LENGTH=170 /DNA_ID=CAMNT_0042762599 /DNA_START=25 /DNA_END=537 /DNA_ORIENTATION=-